MKNKKMKSLLDVLVIIVVNFCIIVFGIWISAVPITKSKSFYMSHFTKNERAQRYLENVYDIENPMEVLEKVAKITIDYYFGNAKEYQVKYEAKNYQGEIVEGELFNADEIEHMKDVKTLYIVGQTIAVICFMLLIGGLIYIIFNFRRLRKKILWVTVSFYVALIVLGSLFFLWGYLAYKNDGMRMPLFNYLFINFHYLIFPFNKHKVDLALGESPLGNVTLTRILDTKLFMDAGLIIGAVTAICVVLWIALIIVFYKIHPKLVKKVDAIHEQAEITRQSLNRA